MSIGNGQQVFMKYCVIINECALFLTHNTCNGCIMFKTNCCFQTITSVALQGQDVLYCLVVDRRIKFITEMLGGV